MLCYGITTEDNPANPLDNPKAWLLYDSWIMNYNTSGLLARIAHTADGLTDEENNEIIGAAIDDIVANIPDPNGKKYIKVTKDIDEDVFEPPKRRKKA